MRVAACAAALLALACSGESMEPADVVFTGGVVWTGDPGEPAAEALAVRGGTIVAVGPAAEVAAHVGTSTEVVDLAGRMALPGFVDAHTHFVAGGFQLSSVDLRDAATPEEFARRIGAFAREVGPDVWITGGDWDHELWGGQLPRREWIDSVTPLNPVLVSRLDGHMALANGLALERAGVSAAAETPPGGEIVRDRAGRPTGVLKDEAMGLVARVAPEPTPEELDRAVDAAVEHALSLGVTEVHDMGTWADLEAYRRAAASGRLGMRVYAFVPLDTWERLRDFVAANGRGDDRLRWGGLKGFVDGSLGSTTAWFAEPYADEPRTSGLTITDTIALGISVAEADAAGLHVAVHAIGDRANDWLLGIYDEIAARNGIRDRRFRIEHAQHLTRHAIAELARQGVIASMQPYHAIDDGRWAEKRIGPKRILTTYAFRDLLDAGATLAFGSDWTVAPLDPLLGVYAAVTRRTTDGTNPDGWVPGQKISLEETLRAYTTGGARAGFMDDRKGVLAQGRLADVVVLSRNLFDLPPEGIPEARVDLTMVGGVIEYRREPR